MKHESLHLNENLKQYREEIAAARKCENINDPIDTYVIDFLAMGFTKLFVKLGIVPNAVTILSMLSGVAGAVLIAQDNLPMTLGGIALVILSAVFDASDGQVARKTRHFSRIGRMLDGMSDATVYFSLYLVTALRASCRPAFGVSPSVWTGLMLALGLLTFVFYVIQSQLPDYFKNLHMYMIDNAHGSELSRAKHVLAERDRAKKGSFERFSLSCYAAYTRTQERRAPITQRMLDRIEVEGKSDAMTDAFYQTSRKLVMATNLMTFNLRTIVLFICLLLRVEPIVFAFCLLVLEPLRLYLLRRYERLAARLLAELPAGEAEREAACV